MFDAEVSPPRMPWLYRLKYWILALFGKGLKSYDEEYDDRGRF